jgi:hypothetical protein
MLNPLKHNKPQKKFLSILEDMWKILKELDNYARWHTYHESS